MRNLAMLLGVAVIAGASSERVPAQECDADAASIHWDQGLLSFSCAPLKDVIAEYNRHALVKLTIPAPELADTLVGGALRTEDPEKVAAGLRRLLQLAARPTREQSVLNAK